MDIVILKHHLMCILTLENLVNLIHDVIKLIYLQF